MNPQLTISILSVLLLANSIATLAYWFKLRMQRQLTDDAEKYSDKWHELARQQTDKLKLAQELIVIKSEQVNRLIKAHSDLQSKLNAAKDALK